LSIIKVITDIDKKSATNDMSILDGYVIKKVEYLAEQELSTTKQTTTHTDEENKIIGFESTIVKTSVIRLIPNINIGNLKENKAVLEKNTDVISIKENKSKAGEIK
jgi:hypothetical protein